MGNGGEGHAQGGCKDEETSSLIGLEWEEKGIVMALALRQ